jgi:hypothetical protein
MNAKEQFSANQISASLKTVGATERYLKFVVRMESLTLNSLRVLSVLCGATLKIFSIAQGSHCLNNSVSSISNRDAQAPAAGPVAKPAPAGHDWLRQLSAKPVLQAFSLARQSAVD